MLRRLSILTGFFFLLACTPAGNPPEDPEDGTPKDPAFTVSGVPGEAVKAFSSFTLSVTSLSKGAIDFSSDKPDVASITLAGLRTYRVQAGNPAAPTQVTLHFAQDASGDYAAANVSIPLSVLPESMDIDPTIPQDSHADIEGIKVTFKEIPAPVSNPERGIYRARDFNTSSPALKASDVKAQRLDGHTLWYIGFYLTDFMTGDISDSYMQQMQATFDALREGGGKCILRFAYRDYHSDNEVMDPEVFVVLRHVEQLKPLLQKNEDVIFVLQAGFVGSWGEWYYTTHFVFQPRTDADYQPRRQLADALLEALPVSRQIQLRTPQFKMRMYGLSLKDTLTAASAHDGSALSRLAGHNDCFGASEDDYGTFDNEKGDRAFWKADTRYTIMGGETCGVSDYCTCTATLKDLKDYHWTYLNKDYHSGVLSRWKSSGCYNEIAARLGYRLVMQDLFYTEDYAAGKPFDIALRFYNTGFAAPMNPRNAELVFADSNGKTHRFPIPEDPRTWHSGFHVVNASLTLPSGKGTFYLALEDPLLPGRPEYSIALANEGVFDPNTGWNKLFELR